ncbi:MAG TPA: UDP-N-acetylmuramoyl-L-alanine--D-glutamate ligase [Firmicutes bacterium]|nr:UDP-N-acetylmuramoyl-L-alanine--D-glutamate ligase [Bacillota bacterium]
MGNNKTKEKIVVLGLGKSGKETALFFAKKGARVIVSDQKGRKDLAGTLASLAPFANITPVLGEQPVSLVDDETTLVVKSPGIPPNIPLLAEARRRGIPVLSEVEVAYHFTRAPIIGITGTNGKTTTTTLVKEILQEAGLKAQVAGNIGIPLISVAERVEIEVLVAELSSFQLLDIKEFRPRISAILNITEDHLDYHRDFEEYVRAKGNILLNQTEADYAVLNADDELVKKVAAASRAKKYYFSRSKALEAGVYVSGGQVVIRDGGKTISVIPVAGLTLPGLHNLENALAAAAVAYCFGVGAAVIARVLRTFKGVEHRLEFVREIKGVKYINDSKGTNPEATVKALEAYREPIILLAGGMDRGSDFSQFAEQVKNKVRHLFLLGETREAIAAALTRAGYHDFTLVGSLQEAVLQAEAMAVAGDIVLLSPACPSWDMFKNFEERGNLFKAYVHALKEEGSSEKN